MRLINSSAKAILQDAGTDTVNTLVGIYKQIELAGRTCYKSEDKITPTSAKEFVDRMINSKHYAMLEHGTVYLIVPINDTTKTHIDDYLSNSYSVVNFIYSYDSDISDYTNKAYITTNYRVLIEHGWLADLQYISQPTIHHEYRLTIKFICDRGVSHEFVRHRVFSFAQESTRWCDYTKTKFGNELTYIIPSWCTLSEGKYKWILFKVCNFDCWGGWQKDSESTETDQNSELGKIIAKRMTDYHWLLYGLESAERNYKSLISLSDWKPQQARAVLPNALKTELVMTGTVSQWLDFLKLRLSTNAHPDAYKLAKEVKQIIDNKEWKNTLLNA